MSGGSSPPTSVSFVPERPVPPRALFSRSQVWRPDGRPVRGGSRVRRRYQPGRCCANL